MYASVTCGDVRTQKFGFGNFIVCGSHRRIITEAQNCNVTYDFENVTPSQWSIEESHEKKSAISQCGIMDILVIALSCRVWVFVDIFCK